MLTALSGSGAEPCLSVAGIHQGLLRGWASYLHHFPGRTNAWPSGPSLKPCWMREPSYLSSKVRLCFFMLKAKHMCLPSLWPCLHPFVLASVCMCTYIYICLCMFVHVCVCIYLCMSVLVGICVYTSMCVCIHVYLCICVHMYVFVYLYSCVCLHVHICVWCTCICANACISVYAYVCTGAYLCTHIGVGISVSTYVQLCARICM